MDKEGKPKSPAVGILILVALLFATGSDSFLRGQSGPRVLLSDQFSSDPSLNTAVWTTDTPLLTSMAANASFILTSTWMEPQISFSSAGMTMTGVRGDYQFTGLQSVQSFTPPFSIQAFVDSSVANGNPFELHLITQDMRERLSVVGNVGKQNAGYYGMWLSCNGPLMDLFTHVNLYSTPDINVWYLITMTVDSQGMASATLRNARGTVLGSRTGMNLGAGPFYVVLSQYEGLPSSGPGPNSATWASVKIRGAGSTHGNSLAQSGGPTITSVTPLLPRASQSITITGYGFGSLPAYNGDSAYIQIDDLTHPWTAGHTSQPVQNWVTLNVRSWTDSQIVLGGFTGRYGMAGTNWTLQTGDRLLLQVWNAQSGVGPALYYTKVGGGGALSVQLGHPSVSGLSVSINGVVTAPGATISEIGWNWGDGSPAQTGSFPETHTYARAGTYTIFVNATASNGLTGSASVTATVVPPSACHNGFSLGVEYGGSLFQECIEGDPSAFHKLAVAYQGGTWPALAAQAVYLQGLVSGSQKPTNIQIFEQNSQILNPTTRYQIIYATLMWGWAYGRLGINPSFLQPYHTLQNKIQNYAQSDWWRELAVGASQADAWLNPMYWINQTINAVFVQVGAATESESEKQFTAYMSLLNTLSQGYQASAASRLKAAGTEAAMNDFRKAGICLPPNYTASQFERALAGAGTQSVNWDQLATQLFRNVLEQVPTRAALTEGSKLGASCLLSVAGASHSLTVEQAAAGETECLAKSASENLAKFLLEKALTQQVLDEGMLDLAAQQGTDQAIETTAQHAAAKEAVQFYVDQSVSRLFFALSIADTIDESYNLPMANEIQESIDAGNAALQDFPAFFQNISSLTNGTMADIGLAPATTDMEGLLNGTLALLYMANAQYCSKTLAGVGCPNQVSSYLANAQAYARTAVDALNAQAAASQFTASLPDTSPPLCATSPLNGGPIPFPVANSNLPSQTIAPSALSINPAVTDQAIVADLNAKLWQDSVLKTLDIRVSAQNGVVTLAGTVNTQLEKAMVDHLAASEAGVRSVMDHLAVSTAP